MPRFSRPMGIGLGIVFVALFAGFVVSNAVETRLLKSSFYEGVLDDANAYERVYDEVAKDPELSAQVDALFGGTDFPIAELAGLFGDLVAPELLRSVVSVGIEQFVDFIKSGDRLNLQLDVTPLLGGIGSGLGDVLADPLSNVPEREADTYAGWRAEVVALGKQVAADGKPPAFIPVFEVPRGQREDASEVIAQAGGIDPAKERGKVADIREAVADDEVGDAIREAVGPLVKAETPNSPAAAAPSLVGRYVREEPGPDGETRYLIGPPEETEKEMADALAIPRLIVELNPWMRFITGILAVGVVALVAWLAGPALSSRLRWGGGTVLAGGVFALLAWTVTRAILAGQVSDAAIPDDGAVAPAYEELIRDVIEQAFANISPSLWLPSFLAVALGGAALLASWALGRGGRGDEPAAETEEPPLLRR